MKKLILSLISYILCLSLMLSQLTFITAVSAQDNPITSAITAAITDATNQNPSPTPTPNPISTPVVDPTLQPPVTAPIPNPNSTPEPVTSPVVNPPATSPVTEPTPTPSTQPTSATPSIVEITSDHPNVVLTSSSPAMTISVSPQVPNPTLDLSSLLITSPTAASVILNNSVSMTRTVSNGSINIQIPAGSMISGPASWNGIISVPTVLNPSTITAPKISGKNSITTSVIEVGSTDKFLTFDKAVRIVIPKQANSLVGFEFGSNFTQITQNCSADSQAAGDALAGGGDCFVNAGSDLVVWTKHFTKFVTYTTQTSPAPHNVLQPVDPRYGFSAPVCGDSKPTSAPKIISATSVEPNTVVLVWAGASDPVTHYLVSYGTKSGKMEYGNPNVGNKKTRTYTVKNLSGNQAYYFKIEAINGCMPGDFSNEVKVNVTGAKLNTQIAQGFKLSNDIAATSGTTEAKFKPITSADPNRLIAEVGSIFEKFINLIKALL